jgi:lipopolysaccharide/colanic/teichoic acid biosynthesis glycosyltransferase
VTTIGRILRRTSIDELPQLFNVLAGHMSLVGPRPALPEEVATFDEELRGRARVRPGITGLWQIEARDNPAFHPYRQLDLFYADNWTPTLDLAILLATVPSVIRHAWKGAMSRRGPSQHHRGGSVQIEVAS